MELEKQEWEELPRFVDREDPKIVIKSQFRIKDMVIATFFIAAAFAIIRACGVAGYEALVGAIVVLVVCGLAVMYFEHGRQERIFYRNRP